MDPRPPEALYTAEQVRELDRRAIEDEGIDGYDLMQRAGAAAYRLLRMRWPAARHLVVLSGGGNNGGDGLVVARLARGAGLQVTLGLNRDPDRLGGAAARAWADWQAVDGHAHACDALEPEAGDVVIDALLGTGLDRPVAGAAAQAIGAVRAAQCPVLALDIPSGIDADTGAVWGEAVRADATVTFIGAKRGLYTGPAVDHTGPVFVDSLGVPERVHAGLAPGVVPIDADWPGAGCPVRRPGAHKGDAGHVLVVGGDHGLAGAARMAGEAALRSGAGLVSVATRSAHAPAMASARPELMVKPIDDPTRELAPLLEQADTVALGPGLGQGAWGAAALDALADCPGQARVVDADALNLAAHREPGELAWSILTPHPGEAARLLGRTTAEVQGDRFGAAQALSDRFDAVVVLKGAGTLVARPRERIRLLPGARPAMASGGMGDVLTGIAAGLWAQGMAVGPAADTAVALHAAAADRARGDWGPYGLVASDLFGYIARLRGIQARG